MRRPVWLVMATLLILTACEGPKEAAGREQDRLLAANNAVADGGAGLNQRRGEAQDRADRADMKARDARADALESEADRLRTEADIAADRLDAQAKVVRGRN